VLLNFDVYPLTQPVRNAASKHTTNDAHKYLREPPTVKPFPIKNSAASNRKSGGCLLYRKCLHGHVREDCISLPWSRLAAPDHLLVEEFPCEPSCWAALKLVHTRNTV